MTVSKISDNSSEVKNKKVPNPIMVYNRHINSDTVQRLEKSYVRLDEIRQNLTAENILRSEQIQYHQQELWKFNQDRRRHNWYSINGCKCSHHNSELSAYGRYHHLGYRMVSKRCPLHMKHHEELVKSGDMVKVSASAFKADVPDVAVYVDDNKFFKIIKP